jgi:hypothetical protein
MFDHPVFGFLSKVCNSLAVAQLQAAVEQTQFLLAQDDWQLPHLLRRQ